MGRIYNPTTITTEETSEQNAAINREFQEIKNVMDEREIYITDRIYYAEPNKPSLFQLVFADGVKWNPGDGVGYYAMTPILDANGAVTSAVWKKMNIT